MNCWVGEADKRERRAMQKELACRADRKKKNEKCEGKVTASHRPTNRSDVSVSKHAPPPYHHYPVAELQALKVDPDLDCSPPKRPTAPRTEEEELEEDPDVIPETPHEVAGESAHGCPDKEKKNQTNGERRKCEYISSDD